VRVTTAFNTMLQISGASVTTVEFTPSGIVVRVRLRRAKLRCPCGWQTRATYDRSVRRWRHLDLGACRLFLKAEIRRLNCWACGRVRTEEVPWARPGARLTRDLEDLVGFLAQRCDKTTVARLLRISWASVHRAVIRVVAEALDPARLQDLFRIGVDEVSWRKGHRYLTVVADHDRGGAVVWAAEGRDHAVLEAFYDELGPGGCAALQAVSLDMGGAYEKATTTKAGHVRQCVDPFQVVKLAMGRLRGPRVDVRFFLELDRGTESSSRLEEKLTGYARVARSPDAPDALLFLFPTERREAEARRALFNCGMLLLTGTRGYAGEDPLSPFWLPVGGDRRIRIVDMGSARRAG